MSVFGSKPPAPVRPSVIPPLEPGDRLTRDEFERRYDATPGLKKAELIEGVVYMPPPVSHENHSAPQADLVWWIGNYRIATRGVRAGDNGSIRLNLHNMPQPDAYLMILPDHGGQARIDEEGYLAGAPELVAEVASSSVSRELHDKLNAYRRNGVREYLVWRTRDHAIDWFRLQGGQFELMKPNGEGILKSEVFPGLWLAPRLLVAGDVAGLMKIAQRGIGSSEHASFAQRPAAARNA